MMCVKDMCVCVCETELTLAFLSTWPRTGGFFCSTWRRSKEALLTGSEHVSVSLVSQLEMGELSTVRLTSTGDCTHTPHHNTPHHTTAQHTHL